MNKKTCHKTIVIFFTLLTFIASGTSGFSQSYVVDGTDILEGFTFGEAAEEIDTTAYNVWIVEKTSDDVFDPVPGSLRYIIEQVNKDDYKSQNNYIRFQIPGDGPFIIALDAELPEINGNVIIDGTLTPGNEPEVIIDGQGQCNALFYIRNFEDNALFHLQNTALINFKSPLYC